MFHGILFELFQCLIFCHFFGIVHGEVGNVYVEVINVYSRQGEFNGECLWGGRRILMGRGGVNVYGGECLQGSGEYFWGIFMRRW